jgi:hypothetical protein
MERVIGTIRCKKYPDACGDKAPRKSENFQHLAAAAFAWLEWSIADSSFFQEEGCCVKIAALRELTTDKRRIFWASYL